MRYPSLLNQNKAHVYDVSRYRFNDIDGRLHRSLAAATMLMEALAGFEHKFEYSIAGHSGDSECIELVEYGAPPRHQQERYACCCRAYFSMRV